jgi:hypothetical protein
MKRILNLILIIVFILSGCSQPERATKINDESNKNYLSKERANKLAEAFYHQFEETEISPDSDDKRRLIGGYLFHLFRISNDGGTLVIAWERKGSGGYNIDIKDINVEKDRTTIVVKETSPKPDQDVTTALTYPRIKKEIDDINVNNISVVNTNGKEYEKIELDYEILFKKYKETHMYEFETDKKITTLKKQLKNLDEKYVFDSERSNYFELHPGYKPYEKLHVTFIKKDGRINNQDVGYLISVLPNHEKGYEIDIYEDDSKFKFGDGREKSYQYVNYERGLTLQSINNKNFIRCLTNDDDLENVCQHFEK